ncbi:HPF/RaiA family ribosome-associated protein [Sulfitobacter sabulilitoris]|uniref:HPF/RaiA family ribosome-associated protein n=1 Tax=Sulfitobacter sabulilitoris TaxID=2562655 RepID=A0A5S3PIY6_9RHOB|nr:HPF/RaiA family ribosome-associated protein [Sulfitobacter sabulilitoris]TMM54349.1 HPF/RaiA family ribosome-associated protein [Sulfitobacter sabulilitoris]
METQPRIIYRGFDPAPDIEPLIRDRIAKLEQVHDRITSCTVTVDLPKKKGVQGHIYRVSIDIEVPTGKVSVSRKPGDVNAHEDLKVALRDSFASARRQLVGHLRRHDGVHVKTHPEKQQGTVVDVFPRDGFGFAALPSGDEVYFQRDSMVGRDWKDVTVGSTLHFTLMEGEKGPYAVNVSLRD